ncbi:MAG TPA: hypothetical protein PLP11_08675, partial [Bacteroidales bacterium]|nr:hypothetical protein [Bacteroidales bacterium]
MNNLCIYPVYAMCCMLCVNRKPVCFAAGFLFFIDETTMPEPFTLPTDSKAKRSSVVERSRDAEVPATARRNACIVPVEVPVLSPLKYRLLHVRTSHSQRR